ncbi:putative Ig domain-containing protein, partial [Pedobacter metabolipauper]
VNDVTPSALSYTTPNVFTKGTAITSLSPTVSGGAVTSYSISPALPTGLNFNTTTGVISGTPTLLKTATDYTVTATNSGGSTTFAVNIAVIDVIPSSLSYTTQNIFTKGTDITSLSPTISGGAITSYSISPALPTGLSFSTTTGVISGTPTVLKTATDYTVTATNSGGSTTFAVNITVNDVTPSALSYTTPNVFTRGTAITSLSPTVSGGAVTSYSISPALPTGLNFSTTTGVISGTPSVLKTATDYTVTATNSGGSTTFAVNITVNDVIPSALSYTTPNVFTKGSAITSLSPTISGGAVTSYSISPALPAGLNFNTTTGVISGTPSVLKTAADYTVTAANSGGSTTFAVNITVNDLTPSALSYTTPNIFTKGTAITSLSPTVNGGVVTSYSITPALPAGLNFSTTTGVISGTPTVIKTAADYTVTATNSGGSTTFAVNITVNDVVPSALSYTTPNIFTKGTAITSLSPTVNGGVVTSYSITPALPAGLNFSTTTGVISGTPTVIKTAADYTVTATNSGGSTTFAVNITVNDVVPSALSYTTPNIFTKGTAITSLSPTVNGGVVTSYSISPALPAGLNFSTTTGVISGTPTIIKTASNYTVTATNTGGNTTASVRITVNDIIPSALSYTTPNVFTKGTAITSLSPTISGGAVTSYSISTVLPTGLNFNTTTGVMSGTPSVLKTATDYTVTATNSGGSTTFAVSITVNDVIPSALSYTTPNVFTKGSAITSLSPTISGGAVTSYSIAPALPTGLNFNTTTGVISGTPTVLKTATDYTVTAINSGGSTTFTVNITVNDVIPSALNYTTPNVFTKGTAITSLSPTVSGGAVTSYSISATLPTGLSFSTTTGVISGTPTVLKTAADYTVTATNSGGSTTFAVNIAVIDVTPSALSYTTPNIFTKGTAITSLSPTVSGGAITSYSISPALPTGLSFSTTTGVISGTPSVLKTVTNYTVTATNTGGNTTASLNIAVNDVIPSALSYTTPNVFTRGTAITSLSPTVSGGAVTSYSISPALPAGLSLNATTGIISGTPAAISPTVNYTVTAANSGGNTTALVSITINSDVTMVTWSAPADLIYGTALSAIQLNASAAIPGTFKYSPEIGTLLHSGTGQMLSVTFRPDNPLYPVSTQSVTINILKAPLRVVANNVSRCYGTQNPALTMQFTGFVNNENEAQIIIPSIASAADLQSAAGTYPITLTGGTAANYTLELVPGTLTVNPLPIVTITSDKGNSIKKGETIHLNTSGNANTYSWTNPDGLISGQGTASISVRPSKTTTFELITTNATGCSSTQTITIEVTEDYSLVKGTNILSNNGDGRNDTWIVRNIDMYPDNTVTIMDRAGRQIYKTKGYQNDWKGMLNGSPLKEGTYYYFIDLGNYRPIIKGFISIINE